MTLSISCRFDAGAIEVQSIQDADDIRVAVRADTRAEFRQWFYFRLQGARDAACRIRFTNAGACTYVEGWKQYAVVASYDRETWFRVPTTFDGTELVVTHAPRYDSVYYAYFEPYEWDRHLALLGRVGRSPRASITRLGSTLEGRDLDLVTIGEAAAGKAPIWCIARQHPGETMAEWFVDGLLTRLIDPRDAMARTLLEGAVFHVVPNMNPDGACAGNLRTNAAGANLNREWLAPSLERSPEVLVVRDAMQRTGAAVFLDVHGDEGLPYVFVDGCERLPSYTPAHGEREARFTEALRAANPDFQTEVGYPRNKDTKVNLALASKWAGDRFGCLSLTLEMPFKDNANLPDTEVGWSGARSARLGADLLPALRAVLS
ncbi:MAG: M14-type cytosolic carboxypeptidase [Casimicrobiaceae bacterium]